MQDPRGVLRPRDPDGQEPQKLTARFDSHPASGDQYAALIICATIRDQQTALESKDRDNDKSHWPSAVITANTAGMSSIQSASGPRY